MFMGMMEQLDTQVGRVLDTLEAQGLSDNTIVLFFGDNGPTPTTRILKQQEDGFYRLTREYYTQTDAEWAARNPSGFRSKKATGWENAVRNRLAIYCPARFESRMVPEMTLVMDLFPTLVEWAEGSRPEGKPTLDGRSLVPLLEGAGEWPERAYFTGETGRPVPQPVADGWQDRFTGQSLPPDQRSTCFVQGDWVVVNDHGTWGLFDLVNDPGQSADLSAAEPERFSVLQQRYAEVLKGIRQDPHAWSDPVQEVGPSAYLEMEGIYRFRGDNAVTWANTFMKEVGAEQEMRIRVLEPGRYQVRLRALGVPPETRLRFTAATGSTESVLNPSQKLHDLGQVGLKAGDQVFALTLLETGDDDRVATMELFSLHLERMK